MSQTAREVAETEVAVADFLPLSHHVSDTVLATKEGAYLSVWRIKGRSHQCADVKDVFRWTEDMNVAVRGIASEKIAFWSHLHRRRVFEYPEAEFDNLFCERLNNKYAETFTGVKLMVNDLYLTVVYRPVTDKVLSFFASKEKRSVKDRIAMQEAAIQIVGDVNRTLAESLAPYGAELLGVYDRDGHAYSSALEWFAFLVNGEHHPMPICRERFCEYMAVNRPLFSTWGELGEIRMADRVRNFGMIEIKDFNDSTEPGQLNVLLESDFEFVMTQSFTALSTYAAKGFFQRHKQQLIDSGDVAVTQIAEIDIALDQLVSRKFIAGEYHGTVLIYGDTPDDVRNSLAKARALLFDRAVVPNVLDLALEAGFWAQHPGNWRHRPRPMTITSLNWLSFSPFHNYMSGKPAGNPWGPAVTILKTTSGTPVYFNFHESGADTDDTDRRLPGSTGMFGKTGSGKTVLLGFLLAQAQKFKPTIVAFDLDYGLSVMIRALGGKYAPLRNGRPTGWNPFQLDPTPTNRTFLKGLVRQLASAEVGISHQDEAEIDAGLEGLLTYIEPRFRRMTSFVQQLPNPMSFDSGRPTVAARLQKWCSGGELGWLFDNETDDLDFATHRVFGFDVTDFLDNPETRIPTMMYLLHRTKRMLDGRRFMFVFDEFWRIIGDEVFETFIKGELKTIRKKNGLCVFATQEPGDALSSNIAKTIVQQLSTIVALYNDKADHDDYVKGLKFTESEFEILRSMPEFSRRFIIKQGDEAAIATLQLAGMEDELSVLSGTPDAHALVDEIVDEVGEDPSNWLPIFWRRVKGDKR